MTTRLFTFLAILFSGYLGAQEFQYAHAMESSVIELHASDAAEGYYSIAKRTGTFVVDPNDTNNTYTPVNSAIHFKHMDGDGLLDWSKILEVPDFPTTSHYEPKSMVSNEAGDFFVLYDSYVSGGNSIDISLSETGTSVIPFTRSILAKYNSQGEVITSKEVGGMGFSCRLLATQDGGALITGPVNTSALDIDGVPGNDFPDMTDGYNTRNVIIKVNSTLGAEWNTYYDRNGYTGDEFLTQAALKNDDGLVIAQSIIGRYYVPGLGTYGSEESYNSLNLIEVSPQGVFRSAHHFEQGAATSGFSRQICISMAIDSQNNIVLSGQTRGPTDLDLDGVLETVSNRSNYILKLTDNYTAVFRQAISTPGSGTFYFKNLSFDDSDVLHSLVVASQRVDMHLGNTNSSDQTLHLPVSFRESQVIYARHDNDLNVLYAAPVGSHDTRTVGDGLLLTDGGFFIIYTPIAGGPIDLQFGPEEAVVHTAVGSNRIMTKYNRCTSTQVNHARTNCPGESIMLEDGEVVNTIPTDGKIYRRVFTPNGCQILNTYTVTVGQQHAIEESVDICSGESYIFPDGTQEMNITSSRSHVSDLSSQSGCDSTVTTNLIVRLSPVVTQSMSICQGESFTFPNGETVQDIADDITQVSVLQTTNGCDSTIISELIVRAPSNRIEFISICEGGDYTFPDGTIVTNIPQDMSYVSELQTSYGCDSIVTTNLSINALEESEEMISICSGSSHTFPDGVTIDNITNEITRVSTVTGSTGCDALITTHLTVYTTEETQEEVSICIGDSYTFPDGVTIDNITNEITRVSTVTSSTGCDALITTHLSIYDTEETLESFTICSGSSYTFPDGEVLENISAEITHVSTVTNSNGCDATITTQLTIENSTAEVTLTNGQLNATPDLANYQWLDCNDAMSPISGATEASFTPIANGIYAVQAEANGCMVISECIDYAVSSVYENALSQAITLYPNPVENQLTINLGDYEHSAPLRVSLYDLSGRAITETVEIPMGLQQHTLDIQAAAGMYLLTLTDGLLSSTQMIEKH